MELEPLFIPHANLEWTQIVEACRMDERQFARSIQEQKTWSAIERRNVIEGPIAALLRPIQPKLMQNSVCNQVAVKTRRAADVFDSHVCGVIIFYHAEADQSWQHVRRR
jgi:hypothetical protein